MPNDKSPRPPQPTPCFHHHNHNQIMLPKRKFEAESYGSLEVRIQEAINVLQERGEEKPNLAAAAREFELPPQRLRARWNGRQSKFDRPAKNTKLSGDQELAVCLYLVRLDAIGTCARKKMVTNCANANRVC
jgi:hypothetical protein